MTQNPPKYDLTLVARAILEEAVELHPRRLTVGELALRIIGDPDDSREMATAIQAAEDLRKFGLFDYRDEDEVVEPTPAALRAFALLVE